MNFVERDETPIFPTAKLCGRTVNGDVPLSLPRTFYFDGLVFIGKFAFNIARPIIALSNRMLREIRWFFSAVPKRITVGLVPKVGFVFSVASVRYNMPTVVVEALYRVFSAAGYEYAVFAFFDFKRSLRIAIKLV